MKGLTSIQKSVLAFIGSYAEAHVCSPSYWEIAEHMGYTSTGFVRATVSSLAKKGYIRKGKRKHHRALRLTGKKFSE